MAVYIHIYPKWNCPWPMLSSNCVKAVPKSPSRPMLGNFLTIKLHNVSVCNLALKTFPEWDPISEMGCPLVMESLSVGVFKESLDLMLRDMV